MKEKENIGQNQARTFGANWPLHAMIVIYAGLWIWMAIAPYSRFDWVLENLLIWAALIALISTYKLITFSNFSYALFGLFLALHTVGAHYSYNENIVDVWMKLILHSERDNYDRLVHFSFGLLLAYPLREAMSAWTQLSRRWLYVMTCVTILALGAFYELIEMWVATLVAPEIGTLFLGTQGDQWDTHHDMALALYGAVIAMVVTAVLGRRRERKFE
jgi:putative membrane protein